MSNRPDTPEKASTPPLPPQPLLEDEELDRLDEFLDSDKVDEDALDLISAHGFMLALAVAPSELQEQQWLAELFQGEPRYQNDAERDDIIKLLSNLRHNAMAVLEQGGLPELPFELTLGGLAAEETPIGDWCAGFMEGVFCDEAAWFAEDEESAATLLLPFMLLSGLFEDEPDMAELAKDIERQEALVAQLPELVLDLYLHYRVPPEPAKPSPRGKQPRGKRQRRS
ncbi:MAG: YecA family protein [Pseudomonadota bacterium]